MKFAVVNLGCKVNRVETDSIAGELLSYGLERASYKEADVVAVNTCTVTGEAEKKTRKAVRRVLRDNQWAMVIVTGCAAAIDEETFCSMDARVTVEPDKTRVAAEAIRILELEPQVAALDSPMRIGEGFKTRVGIKMQDGCDNGCTYCIVHVARGRSTSRPFPEVSAEVKKYAAQGTREIVLTGINLGSYRDSDRTLADALEELLEQTDGVRFRISSIEPNDVSPKLVQLMADAGGRICRHLHLPLQSGSSKVLAQMARPYDAARFRHIVDTLYAAIPQLSLSTDLIVGFPGETNEDFEHSIQMVEDCRFSKVHVFPYSKREGTPAALRNDQVDPQCKARRVAHMGVVAQNMRQEAYDLRKGTVETVLVEKQGFAMTESYFSVAVPTDAQVGALIDVMLP